MKNEKVWKLNIVLWCIVLVASVVGIALWLKKYFTTGDVEGLPIFLFVCSSFSAVIWDDCVSPREEERRVVKKRFPSPLATLVSGNDVFEKFTRNFELTESDDVFRLVIVEASVRFKT